MYNSDNPISRSENDLLGRKNFAEQLARSINLFNNNDTFTIALYGEWGSGKTSVINMMINEMETLSHKHPEYNNPIVLNFEPWNFYDTNQLINQFFIQLSNKFSNKKDKTLSKVGEAIEKYSDAFEIANGIPIIGGAVGYIGRKASIMLGRKLNKNNTDISRQKENIINLLKNVNKKILVIIDDIDRLSNEQIRQVFQLVTSVAKFPNMIYLLAFDRNVVVNALEKIQEGDGNEYLKKIIQIPIQLPQIESVSLKNILFDKLQYVLNKNKDINFDRVHWQTIFEPCIWSLINNIRDINQLCNSVQFKLASIASEVDFADMVAISALEMNYQEIFEWIRENKSILTGSFGVSMIQLSNKSQEDIKALYYNEMSVLLQSSTDEKNINNKVNYVLTYLSYLFPYFGKKIGDIYEEYDVNKLRLNNRIAHESRFDRYFNLNIDKLSLKSYEIKEVIYTLECNDLVSFFLEKDKENFAYELLKEIQANIDKIQLNRAKILSEALLEISYQLEVRYDMLQLDIRSYIQFLLRDLINIIDPNDRMFYIKTLLENASLNQMQTFADFFNITELSYGRLAAKGEKHQYKKLITLPELEELEKLFCEKIKYLSTQYNLLDFLNARMYIYLFETLDPICFEKYMKECLILDENKLKYASLYVTQWIGNGVEYELNKDFEKFLSSKEIVETIEKLITNKKFFDMSLDVQRRCCALYIKITSGKSYPMGVTQDEVDKLLEDWK